MVERILRLVEVHGFPLALRTGAVEGTSRRRLGRACLGGMASLCTGMLVVQLLGHWRHANLPESKQLTPIRTNRHPATRSSWDGGNNY